MVTLQSLGPIQNYNFRWGSNLHSVDLSQKERTEANVLVGIWRKRFIWTKEDGDSIILGPIEN